MNRFRTSTQFDDFNEHICLKCMGKFSCHDIWAEKWSLCPLCGTKWDGEFTKRRKKYPEKVRDWRQPGYKMDEKTGLMCQSDEMRLIIETGDEVTSLLSPIGFFAEACKPHVRWHLYSHTTSGWSSDKSAFVDMYRRYNEYVSGPKQHYPRLRMRLLVGTTSKVLKEWSRSEAQQGVTGRG